MKIPEKGMRLLALLLMAVLLGSCFSEPVCAAADSLMSGFTPHRFGIFYADRAGQDDLLSFYGDGDAIVSVTVNGSETAPSPGDDLSGGNPVYRVDVDALGDCEILVSFAAYRAQLLWFEQSENGGSILLSDLDDANAEPRTYSLAADTQGYLKIRTSGPYLLAFLLKVAVWLAVCSVCFLLLLLLYGAVARISRLPRLLRAAVTWKHFVCLFFFFYLFAVIAYRYVKIPGFLEYGDQRYYWTDVRFLIDGRFTMDDYIRKMPYTFRGVFCMVPSSIAHAMGEVVGVNPVYFVLGLSSLAAAFLAGYALPRLYALLAGVACRLWQLTALVAIYLVFWPWTLTHILTDVYGAAFFFGGLLFVLTYGRDGKIHWLVLGAAFWYISISFRGAYQLAVYAVSAWLLAGAAFRFARSRRQGTGPKRRIRWKPALKTALGFALAAAAVLLLGVPQLQVNRAHGHGGIFPYDSADCYPLSKGEYTVVELISSTSLTSGFVDSAVGYDADEQVQNIKLSQGYDYDETLHMDQLMDLLISKPLDTMVYLGKKLFEGFNLQINAVYLRKDPEGLAPYWSRRLLSYANYALIFCCLYSFARGKYAKAEKQILGLAFLFTVAPQLIIHVEWRYFLAGYLVLYYCFVFRFLPLLARRESRREILGPRFLWSLGGYLYLCFWISTSIQA